MYLFEDKLKIEQARLALQQILQKQNDSNKRFGLTGSEVSTCNGYLNPLNEIFKKALSS